MVEEKGIDIVGTVVATHLHKAGGHLEAWRLIRIKPPLRLRTSVTGVYTDGWTGASSAYTRYSTEHNRTGRIRIILSRKGWGGPDKPGHVTVALGPIVIGDDNQPHVGTPAVVRRITIHSKQQVTVVVKAPGPRFRVEVNIDPTFVIYFYFLIAVQGLQQASGHASMSIPLLSHNIISSCSKSGSRIIFA